MKIKLIANVEISGNIKRFNSFVHNNKVKNVLYDMDDYSLVYEEILDDFEFIELNKEQGKRFVIEVEIVAEIDEIFDIDYMCVIEKNSYISVVGNTIKKIEVLCG